MNRGNLRRCLATGLLGIALSGTLIAQVNVSTYHNDAARTGQYTQETILTPANVNSTLFGKLLSVTVDGVVYAQPLYLSAVNISGGTHNVLYVATEHDSVYAIDADTGTIYARVSLLPTGGVPVDSKTDFSCSDLVKEIGITGTPVIDAASGTLYVVAKAKVGSTFVQYLHALDVTTLNEKLSGPVPIHASVTGTGYDATGGTITFNAKWENQRPALLLDHGHVVIGWSSHCDDDPWHGWVISYNAGTLAQEATFNASPNGNRNGVWMSGSGISADAAGNLFLATGNGTWNGASDFGDSIVKLSPPSSGNLGVLDYFTPYDQGLLSSQDQDLGSGGVVLLPQLPSGKQLLAQQGKAGTIYLLDTSNLGKYCINLKPACTNHDPQVLQEIINASAGIWGAPAYWNGNVYWAGTNDKIKAYSFNAGGSGLLSVSPTSTSAQSFGFPGLTPAISANGNANGILWGLHASPATLYAYDASNLGNLLYTSAQAANNRDSPGSTVKFVSPMIANGKVYFGTQTAVVGYGLLSASVPQATSPVLNPAPGLYTSAQSVSITDSTPGAVIYYTTNGATPTTQSAVFNASAPLQITTSTTLQALAVASGFSNSPVTSGSYTINAQGIGSISVNLSSVDNVVGITADGSRVQNAGIDGASYAYSATLLGNSISWGGSNFTVGNAVSMNAVTGATIALPAGNHTTVNILATAVNGAQKNQSFIVTYTDGTTSSFTQSLSDWLTPQNFAGESQVVKMAYRIGPTGASQNGPWYLYGYTFAINSAKTVKNISLPKNRNVVVLAVDVSSAGTAPPPTAASPVLSPTPGTYTDAQSVTLTDSTPGAVIYYTTNGTMPTTQSATFKAASPLQITTSTTVQALAAASGYNNSAVSSGSYTINSQGTGSSVSVNLSAIDNVVGINADGSRVQNGGMDGDSYAYSATLLGTSVSWAGSSYTLGSPGSLSAVTSATIALPASNDTALSFLAAAVNGAQRNQTFIVTYTDGTTSSFTQSLSDWLSPQSFNGESQVVKMAYRIGPTGTAQNGPWYLYGYSFAINGAKTVKSITLPKNRNVVVLALDVSSLGTAPPPAASPVLSPTPGTYAAAQSVTLTDSTPGAVIYYTTDGTTPTIHSAMFTAGTPLQISTSTTVQALAAASGYSNSAVNSGSYTISSQGTGSSVSVNLSAVDNAAGIAANGSAVQQAGLDGESYAYSAALLGTSINWAGSSYALGSAGSLNAVTRATIALPPGNDTTINLLATGANGPQKNQVFVVTYTDGATSSFTQSLSDWFAPQNFTGESQAVKMAYRVGPTGATQNGPWYLYGYSFAIDSAKTVKSITLPNNRSVVVLAVDVTPAG